ncbi:MAG TPA: hypothetical protein VK932_28690 [Kofleriaceae bacterium]|nr:hypothetical protein [Kofleriaceae bacterium]
MWAASLVAALALAPWLALAPLGGVPAVAAGVLALVAALHGAGLALAWLARRPDVHPLLAIQWGIATLLGLFGLALAAGAGGLATQAVLVYGFAAVHTAALALRSASYRARLAATRPALRLWLVPAGLLVGIAAIHVLGAAGDTGAYPFDDDGHVLAQLERLRQTGALGDPIGHARTSQLGGQLAFGALATLGGDVHLVRLAEALALVLAVGLALARLRPPGAPDAASGLWALLLVLAAAAFTYTRLDPGACWTAVGLILALHATLADRAENRSLLPIGVLAGALVTLRFELAPIAAAALAAAWWPRRGSLRAIAVLSAGALAVVLPYLAARVLAWSSVPAAARALVEPWRTPLGAQLAIAAGVAAACAPLVLVAWREASLRWLAVGAALTIGGIAGQLTGERPYAATFLWPLAIAAALALAVEIARNRKVTTAALLVSLLAAVFIHEGRTASGRRRWVRRYLTLAENIEHLRTSREAAPVAGGYAPLLRDVPAGAVVAVWVARPERLDYAAPHRIIDLRTPRAAWMRRDHPFARGAPLDSLLAHVRADFLLLEADDRTRARAARFRALCTTAPAFCTDDLESLALRHPTLAESGGIRLLDLRAAPRPSSPPIP